MIFVQRYKDIGVKIHCFSSATSSLICPQACLKHKNTSVTRVWWGAASIRLYCFTEEIILHWTDYSTNTQLGHWLSSPACLSPSQVGRTEPCSHLSAPSWGAKGSTPEPWENPLSSWDDGAAHRVHQDGHAGTQVPISLFLQQLKFLHWHEPSELCWRDRHFSKPWKLPGKSVLPSEDGQPKHACPEGFLLSKCLLSDQSRAWSLVPWASSSTTQSCSVVEIFPAIHYSLLLQFA